MVEERVPAACSRIGGRMLRSVWWVSRISPCKTKHILGRCPATAWLPGLSLGGQPVGHLLAAVGMIVI